MRKRSRTYRLAASVASASPEAAPNAVMRIPKISITNSPGESRRPGWRGRDRLARPHALGLGCGVGLRVHAEDDFLISTSIESF